MRATIKLKLALTFGAIIVLAGAMAWVGTSSLGSLNAAMEDVIQGPVERQRMAAELYTDLLQILRAEKNMILADNDEMAARYDAEVMKQRTEFLSRRDKLEVIATGDGKERLAQLATPWQQWVGVEDKIRDLVRHGGHAEAKALSEGQGRQLVADISKGLLDIVDINKRLLLQAKEDAAKQYQRAWQMFIAATVAVLVIAVAAGLWISIGISRGLPAAISLRLWRSPPMTRSRISSPRSIPWSRSCEL
jgi:methyl-accepting chemotaxis protein